MIIENIYDGKKSNNKINKRKYRKHSMSPFCSLNAGNVEKNVEMFNHMSDVGDAPSSASGDNGGAGMGESLMEDIASTQKQYSYIPENDFFEIISLDPTYNPDRDSVGKYGKWLLGLYKKDNPLNHENEEIYTLLSQYDEYKNDRKYQIEKDINKFKSFNDLSNAIDSVGNAELSSRQKERELRTSNDYKVVYKDDDWTIYTPLSYAGSCTLGKGTRWCTAYSDDDSYYNDYTADGPLYILINNHDKSDKYQFHFESESFMDVNDDEINIVKFFQQFPDVAEFFGISTHIICLGSGIDANDENTKYVVSVDIKEGTKEIEPNAFYHCDSLKSITIPSSVTSIGDYAFRYCKSLQSITIPNSVTSIGDNAFVSCGSLKSITIPSSVTSIGDGVFEGCSSLQSVTIPNSVTSIGKYVFYQCFSLESITIPNSVTDIEEGAFNDCRSLQSIIIPNFVTSIGDNVFEDCSSLKSIKIPNSVTSISNYTFSNCSSLESITIPNSVTRIGDEAFIYCTSLQSATIPNSVTDIGEWAFSNCRSLETLITTKNSYAENYFTENYPYVNIKYLNTNESLNETAKPTYTYSYIGPVYRFENIYTVLKEPVYTTAQNRKQAATMLKGKLKQEFGFDYKAKLDIDEENIRELSPIELEDEQDYYSYRNNKLDNHDEDDMVGYINGKPIYFEDGYYTIGGIGGTFISFEEAKEYLED